MDWGTTWVVVGLVGRRASVSASVAVGSVRVVGFDAAAESVRDMSTNVNRV